MLLNLTRNSQFKSNYNFNLDSSELYPLALAQGRAGTFQQYRA